MGGRQKITMALLFEKNRNVFPKRSAIVIPCGLLVFGFMWVIYVKGSVSGKGMAH